MVETSTIIESIFFLLDRIGSSDKLKLVKLLYFADKYHLIKYGRTITNDEYWAMSLGPVGSTIKDILEYDENFTISDNERTYAEKFFSKINGNNFEANQLKLKPKFMFLSETDIEALEETIKCFGSMDSLKISKISHKYNEWAQYKDLFKNKKTSRERIQTEELISTISNDPLGFTEKDIQNSKDFFNGTC